MYSDEILVWRGFKNSIFLQEDINWFAILLLNNSDIFESQQSPLLYKNILGNCKIFRSSFNVLRQFARWFYKKNNEKRMREKLNTDGSRNWFLFTWRVSTDRGERKEREKKREIGSFYRPVWELVGHMHHCERIRDQLTYPGHRVKLCKFVFIRNLSRREDLGQSDSCTNGLLRRENEKS